MCIMEASIISDIYPTGLGEIPGVGRILFRKNLILGEKLSLTKSSNVFFIYHEKKRYRRYKCRWLEKATSGHRAPTHLTKRYEIKGTENETNKQKK